MCPAHPFSFGAPKIFCPLRFENILCMDADLQHEPEAVPDVSRPVIGGSAELTVGSRHVDGYYVYFPTLVFLLFSLHILVEGEDLDLNGRYTAESFLGQRLLLRTVFQALVIQCRGSFAPQRLCLPEVLTGVQ